MQLLTNSNKEIKAIAQYLGIKHSTASYTTINVTIICKHTIGQSSKATTKAYLHTGGGSKYASYSHRKLLKEHDMLQSMSRKDDYWNNAASESFFIH